MRKAPAMSDCCCHTGADVPTYRCEKYGIEMCDACLRCKDPELYCKFRSACMVQFLEKERSDEQRQKSEEG